MTCFTGKISNNRWQSFILEQQVLFDTLMSLDMHNDRQINLEKEIRIMEETDEVQISYDFLA